MGIEPLPSRAGAGAGEGGSRSRQPQCNGEWVGLSSASFCPCVSLFVFPGSWSSPRHRLKNPGVGTWIATEKLGKERTGKDREQGESERVMEGIDLGTGSNSKEADERRGGCRVASSIMQRHIRSIPYLQQLIWCIPRCIQCLLCSTKVLCQILGFLQS